MNGSTKASKAWTDYWRGLDDGLKMAGSLLFFPFFVIVGLGYGLRSGIIEGLKRTLKAMEEWG